MTGFSRMDDMTFISAPHLGDCGQTIRVVACIEERAVIRRILMHLRLWEEPEPRPPPIIEPPAPVDIEYIPCYE